MAVGEQFTCALIQTKIGSGESQQELISIKCWGRNDHGQLLLGPQWTPVLSPRPPASPPAVAALDNLWRRSESEPSPT